jgi:hypothetical protein
MQQYVLGITLFLWRIFFLSSRIRGNDKTQIEETSLENTPTNFLFSISSEHRFSCMQGMVEKKNLY